MVPDPTWTDQVLWLPLKQYDARGTFFMQGAMVENYPDVARRVVAAGNRVENHSYNHPYLTNLSYSSIVDGQLLPYQHGDQERHGTDPDLRPAALRGHQQWREGCDRRHRNDPTALGCGSQGLVKPGAGASSTG